MMQYVLMAIAGIWMADGLVLLAMPDRIVTLLKASLTLSPSLAKWSGVGILLGVVLLIWSDGMTYQPLWIVVGLGMIGKGLFFMWAPPSVRASVLQWCLNRDLIDYRFWGLGLCALALLLLDSLGWLKAR